MKNIHENNRFSVKNVPTCYNVHVKSFEAQKACLRRDKGPQVGEVTRLGEVKK